MRALLLHESLQQPAVEGKTAVLQLDRTHLYQAVEMYCYRLAPHTQHVGQRLMSQARAQHHVCALLLPHGFSQCEQLAREAPARISESHRLEVLLPVLQTSTDQPQQIVGNVRVSRQESLHQWPVKRRDRRVFRGLGKVASLAGHGEHPIEATALDQLEEEFPAIRGQLVRLQTALKKEVKEALVAAPGCSAACLWERCGDGFLRGSKHNLLMAGVALGEVGLIRLRLGDLDGAAEALRQAHELGGECEPGQSLLLLARGDASAALASISREVEGAGVEPSSAAATFPRWSPWPWPRLTNSVLRRPPRNWNHSRTLMGPPRSKPRPRRPGERFNCTMGATRDAGASLHRAIELWLELDAPYEAAQTRALLALAHEREGDLVGARPELQAASSTFERLGAIPDAQRQRAHLDQLSEVRGTGTDAGFTFMFTDIVGSTVLAAAIGDEAWTELSGWHDRGLRELFEEHGGKEVDHAGDGFLVAFTNIDAALSCAVAIQRRMTEHRRKAGFAPKLRVGLRSGPARRVAGGYRGREVHVASRIADLAGAEEVIVSAASLAQSRSRRVTSEPRLVRLKGVPELVPVVTLDWRAPQPP